MISLLIYQNFQFQKNPLNTDYILLHPVLWGQAMRQRKLGGVRTRMTRPARRDEDGAGDVLNSVCHRFRRFVVRRDAVFSVGISRSA